MRALFRSLLITGLTAVFAVPAAAGPDLDAPLKGPNSLVPAGVEIQARGPVHEAFARPVSFQPEPPPALPKGPPAPIPEEPPDLRPEGDNVQWIGGYWAWDADRNEFIWVSGTYRNAPPGERWIPGYWENSADGWRWVPGFWSPQAKPELPYLPQPPAPLDNGPSVPAPNDNSFYTPGTWMYRNTSYVWRPGYWQPCQPGLIWVPASYAWTPSGYVFVDGYWDYPLDGRGLLFAPVAFTQPLWQTPGWSYQPSYVVSVAPLLNAFFVGPRGGSYYFGNYYGPAYARRGFQPWFAYGPRSRDPLSSYYGWANRGNPGWLPSLRQNALRGGPRLVTPLRQYRGPNVRLAQVTAPQRALQRANAQRLREVALARSRTGLASRSPHGPAGARSATAFRLPGAVSRAPTLSPRGTVATNARPVSPHITSGVPRSPVATTRAAQASLYRAPTVPPRVHVLPPRTAPVAPRTAAVRPHTPTYAARPAAVSRPRPQVAASRPAAARVAHVARPQPAHVARHNPQPAHRAAPAHHAAPAHRPAPVHHAAPAHHAAHGRH